MRLRHLAAAGLLAASFTAAHADTLFNYTVTGQGVISYPDEYGNYSETYEPLRGSAVFDVDTGTFTVFLVPTKNWVDINLAGSSLEDPSSPSFSCLRDVPDYTCSGIEGTLDYGILYSAEWAVKDYNSKAWNSTGGYNRIEYDYGGFLDLDEPVVTPEPSTFALCVSGLFSAACVIRRKQI